MLKIISLEFNIPSEKVLNTSFDSINSLLDADIVLIEPGRLSEIVRRRASSGEMPGLFDRRRKEILTLLEHGKIIISFLSPKAVVTVVSPGGHSILVSNYDWLPSTLIGPFSTLIAPGLGTEILLKIPQHPFAPYFQAFREQLLYAAYLEQEPPAGRDKCFLTNKVGKAVAVSFRFHDGLVVFVPYIREGIIDPNKIVGVLVQCVRPILGKSPRTAPPEWAKRYAVPGEARILDEIRAIEGKVQEEENRLKEARDKLITLSDYRSLLYEKGKPLEEVVLKAFALIGFGAEQLQRGDLEHDVVLSAPEGRAIAEVEGRDVEAIHIEKFDHLSRVVDEDFHENSEYAHGILIGNPYRLQLPKDRQKPFTDKVLIAAQRKNFGLLTTVELFQAVTKILENPSDENLKATLRQTLLQNGGKEIRFP